MIYRITLCLAFDNLDAVMDILDKTSDHLPNAVAINLGKLNEEIGFIHIEKCFHDEEPSKDCETILHQEAP